MASGRIEKTFTKYATPYRVMADWTSTSNENTNSSTVSVVLKLYCPYALYIGARNHTITIAGTTYTVSSSAIRTDSAATFTLGTASKTVSHDSDGSGSATISFKAAINANIGGIDYYNITGSGTANLDDIEVDDGGDDGGGDSGGTIPSVPNAITADKTTFTIGDTINFRLTLHYPSGYSTIYWRALNDYRGRIGAEEFHGYQIEWTTPVGLHTHMTSPEEELVVICETYDGNDNFIGSDEVVLTMKANVEACRPIISNVEFTNNSVDLSGDEDTLVRYASQATVYFEATGQYGAGISSMEVICGNETLITLPATFQGVQSGTFYLVATDSRGISTTVEINKNLIDYIKLTCNFDIKPPTAEGELSNARIYGNFYNSVFGNIRNVLTLYYRYKLNEGDYTEWTVINPVITDNTYNYSFSMTGLDYKSTYTFQAKAVDNLLEAITDEIAVRTTPLFDWGQADFHFNVPVVFNEGITIGGKEECRLLWTGADQMDTGTSISLSQSISEQKHGLVLVFSGYDTDYNTPKDSSFNCFFVPKTQAEFHMGEVGHTFIMGINAGFSLIGAKYLGFPSDGTILGMSSNTASGQNSGIMFDNSKFCLRYVIGV